MPKKTPKSTKAVESSDLQSDEDILRQRRRIEAVQTADLVLLVVSWGLWLLAGIWLLAFDEINEQRQSLSPGLEEALLNLLVCGQFCGMISRLATHGNWPAWRKPWYLAWVLALALWAFLFFQASAPWIAGFCGLQAVAMLWACPASGPAGTSKACDASMGRALVLMDGIIGLLWSIKQATQISWHRSSDALAISMSTLPLLMVSVGLLSSSAEGELLTSVPVVLLYFAGFGATSVLKENYGSLAVFLVLILAHAALYLPFPPNDPESNPFHNSFKRSLQRCAKFMAQPVSGFGDEGSGG